MNVNGSPTRKPQCGQPIGMLLLAAFIMGLATVILLSIIIIKNAVETDAVAPVPDQPITFAQAAYVTDLPSKASLAKERAPTVTRSVVRKPIATSKPKPVAKPKPVVKPAPAPVKKVQAPAPAPKPRNVAWQSPSVQSIFAKYPASVEQFAWCVVKHESWRSGRWTAENPYSTASGAFQFIDSTWRAYLAQAGLSGPGHAAYASPELQVRVFVHVIAQGGHRNWNGTSCGYGT